MPERSGATGGSLIARQRTNIARSSAAAGALLQPTIAARAAEWPFDSPAVAAFGRLQQHEIAALALIVGAVFFAVFSAILLVRSRSRAGERQAAASEHIAALKSDVDRLTGLLLADPQVVVSWAVGSEAPDIIGDTAGLTGNAGHDSVLAFAGWLPIEQARAMERAVENLRARGEAFSRSLTTLAGRLVEAEGRAIAGRAVMKLRDMSALERKLSDLNAAHEALRDEAGALHGLIEALPAAAWLRDASGKLAFVNTAYARAVEAADGATALARESELLDASARDALVRAAAAGGRASMRVPTVLGGKPHSFDVIEIPTPRGRAGIGIDATAVETLTRELGRLADAHRRTLDQIEAAVATFGVDGKLTFYTAAYVALWGLDGAFLDQHPSDSEVLNRLRNDRKLPDQRDFRQWKAQLHASYRATEPQTQMWHLPDGRTLRVVAVPHPEGGVTYLFNNVTERLDLERRFDSLIHVQGETLDNLVEALAVFGSDGRIRLSNPAFTRMWRIDPLELLEHPHIETVIGLCRPLHPDDSTWQRLRTAVTALDRRDAVAMRVELDNGVVADCSTIPLPDGGTLIAFQDVTDSVYVERALRERNEALVAADEMKIRFVRHVSYELRSPLTNIIGFAELLSTSGTGTLNERQREYLGHITNSTDALLALINNILDLATIDARAMTLNLGPVDIRGTMAAAAEGIRDRLVKDGILLDIRARADIGSFTADGPRVRQVLFNLLSNAVGFSAPGATVTLAAERTVGAIVFSVTDRGPGIPPEMQDRVFDWFETNTTGSRHRGPGLGLSLVRSFVELHGGTVALDSAVGRGTTVICRFPLEQAARRTAAE